MTDFLIRDLDPGLLARLRERAKANGRSLQSEIHMILERSTRLSRSESVALIERARGGMPHFADDSAPLIREDRESR